MYSMRVSFLFQSIELQNTNTLVKERGLIQGMASMFNGLGMGLGGPIGGLVSDW